MLSLRHCCRELAVRGVFAALAALAAAPAAAQTPAQTPASGSAAAPAANVFRPEIATPLRAAEEQIRARNYAGALASIRAAEAVPDRTASENLAIDRMRGIAASGAGDIPTATRSFEALVASGRLEPADRMGIIEALAKLAFQAKDYGRSAAWAAQYLKDGGANAELRWLMIRAYYLADDCASAARELRPVVEADAKAGTAPQQERLQMLANCYAKQGDAAGYGYALDRLLAYYPSREYWADAIRRVEARPGFADRLTLDVLRLRRATGTLGGAADYAAMAQLALAAGLPAEAKRVSDLGFAAGMLGSGPDADQHRRTRELASKQVAEDVKQLPQSAQAAAAAADGNALVNVGFAFVSAEQYDRGIALMEQGMQRGGLKRPDDARLHLAISYLAAGHKARALLAFKEVGGTEGTADLARLWAIHAQRP